MALLANPVMGDDPPDPTHPCECTVEDTKFQLRKYVDGLLYSNNLELHHAVSLKEADRMADDLIDRLIEPVGTCGECYHA